MLDNVKAFPQIGEITLHVWTPNHSAIKFYATFGFATTGTIENYYRRLTPSDCVILTKTIVAEPEAAPPPPPAA